MGKEIVWKDILGYEGLYKVNNLGEVMSLTRIVDYHHSKVTRKGGIRATRLDRGGYPYLSLCKNAVKKTFKVHRLVAQAFLPLCENKNSVDHIDGNKQNNNVSNLRWCNNHENIKYAWDLNLYANSVGEKHPKAVLTTFQVIEIKQLISKGIKNRDLVKLFKVKTGVIECIKYGKTWKHVLV